MLSPKTISQLNAEIDAAVNVAGPAPRKTTASGLNGLLKSLAVELTAPATTVQNSLVPSTPTAPPSVAAVNAALAGLNTALTAEKTRLDTLVTGAPAALDTLAEISRQLAADERGTAALLATQSQHTQQLAGLKPLVAGANIAFSPGPTPGSLVVNATTAPDVLSAAARRFHDGSWLPCPTYAEALAGLGPAELAVLNRPQAAVGIATATRCYGSVDAAGLPLVVDAVLSFGCYQGYVRHADFSGRGRLLATSVGVPDGCVFVLAQVRSSVNLTVGAGARLSLDGYVATAPHTITYAGTLVIHANCDLTGVTLEPNGSGVLDDRRALAAAPAARPGCCRRRKHCCRPCRRGKTIIRLLKPAR